MHGIAQPTLLSVVNRPVSRGPHHNVCLYKGAFSLSLCVLLIIHVKYLFHGCVCVRTSRPEGGQIGVPQREVSTKEKAEHQLGSKPALHPA